LDQKQNSNEKNLSNLIEKTENDLRVLVNETLRQEFGDWMHNPKYITVKLEKIIQEQSNTKY